MAHYLFAEFLSDRGQYDSALRYWETLWHEVSSSRSLDQTAWTLHWMKNPFADGNPMFTAVNWPLHKGVRIIQEEPGSLDDRDLDWWLDKFGDENDADVIRELVIACCPSTENAPKIRQLLEQWAQDEEVLPPQANDSPE